MTNRDSEIINTQQATIRNQHKQIISIKQEISLALSDLQLGNAKEATRKMRQLVLGRELQS